MSRTRFATVSRRINAEKRLRRIGTARVKLEVLDFPNSKHLNPDNVERLKRLFRGGSGCVPEDFANRIPAIINECQLLEALTISGITSGELLSDGLEHPNLEFPPGSRLICLRGRHRTKAADEVLISTNKFWVVDLYAADITDEAKKDLIEEYTSERRPEDGEFYYKIREYQGVFGEKNPYFERRWWARLASMSNSTNKKKRLEQLFAHRNFAPAFDSFRHLRAIYTGLRLSVINKMTAMGCLEELLSSLKNIRDFWYFVFDNNETSMHRLDEDSLKAVELTAPGACETESRRLYGRVVSGEIFGAFEEQERMNLWTRLCSASTDCLVPSLFAFFENLKYLQVAADCMKRLVHLEKNESIRSALENSYSDRSDRNCLIQLSTLSFREISADGVDQFDIVYRQLWLFALREYQDVPAEPKKKLAGPNGGKANENVLFSFASLANKLGICSQEITELLQRDPDREMARRFLTTARRPEDYVYDDLESCIAQVVNITCMARTTQERTDTDEGEIMEHSKPPSRCGISNYDDQPRDKKSMFLEKMHAPIGKQGATLTSFFIRRSIYFTYFGKDLSISTESSASVPEVDICDGQTTFQNRPVMEPAELRSQTTNWQEQVRQPEGLGLSSAELQEREGRLMQLAEKEQGQRAEIEKLQEELAMLKEQLLTATNEESSLQGKLETLRQAEAEEVIRLDKLRAEAHERQNKIGQWEKTQHNLGDEIRLDLLASECRDLPVVGGPLAEGPELATTETFIQALEAEKQRLQAIVDELSVITRQLTADEAEGQRRVASLVAREQEHQAIINRLAAKELELRQTIDQLRTDEEKRQKRVESLIAKEQERQSAVDRLATRELELRQTVDQLAACVERLETKINQTTAGQKDRESRVEHDPTYTRGEVESLRNEGQAGGGDKEIRIVFKVKNRGVWEHSHEILVDPTDSSEQVRRMAMKYRRKGMVTFDSNDRVMNPRVCFDRVMSDGTNTIRLVQESEVESKGHAPDLDKLMSNKRR